MKDETKLKDMTNFLENVYKDIKEQPTIEEEQKQEKEFINKIKGNNTNEIKEIIDLDIDRDDKLVFIDYTDNLGNKHEYEDINAEQLLDYITNLQEENNKLKQIIDIRECQLEEMQMNKTDYTQVNILEMQLEDKNKEIERLNKIIDELEKWLKDTYNHFMYDNCEEILHNKPEEMEKYGFMYNLSSIHDKANIIEIIRKKLKELKEEGNKDE